VSIFGFVLSSYLAYFYQSYRRAVREAAELDLAQNADVSSRWMDLSRNFDDEVELSEKLIFLGPKRKRLCREARGNVLEVSAGTGRNMDYYELDPIRTPRTQRIKSLVFNDLSEIMIYQAEKKFDALQEGREAVAKFRGPVKFVVGDASDRRVITRPEGGFDTIIQTMGVCSMANPVGFLKRLGDLCRQPGEKSTGVEEDVQEAIVKEEANARKDYGALEHGLPQAGTEGAGSAGDKGGKILLLEHGRSYYNFINRFLDNNAKMHAHRYGCWNNKDIEQVVRDSGLVVESKKRYHFGTTYEYVLRPSRQADKTA
jgi:methyltransferase OMS1